MLGIDHGAIGERLAATGCSAGRWARPSGPITVSTPSSPEYPAQCLIVHLADALCYHVGIGDMGEAVVLLPDDPALLESGIGPDMLGPP